MKKQRIFLYLMAFLILFLFFRIPGRSLTIYSTVTGGNWNAIGTWEGGQFPGATDDVIIRTGATVNTILGTYNTCNNLTVQSGSTLVYNGSGTVVLTLNGSLTNNGTIKNGTGNLTLNIYQNFSFQGTELSNYKITFLGTANHSISFGVGKTFSGSYFYVEGTPRQLYSSTSVSFTNSIVDFNGSTLLLANDSALSIEGQSLSDIILTGTNNHLLMTGGSVLYNSTLTGSTLHGTIRTGSGTINFNDLVTLTQGTTLENYGSSHIVYVNGSVINNGTITNTSNNLTLRITGNIFHNGIWNNYETSLSGTTDQEVTFGDGIYFAGSNFFSSNPTGKSIHFLSDVTFRGTFLNFAYGAGGSIRGNVLITDGKCLKVSGEGSAKYLTRIHVISTGNTAKVWLLNGAYLSSFSSDVNILTLQGYVQAGNSEIYLEHDVYIMDTLINYGGSTHLVYMNGNLHNMGYIMDGTANLEIQCTCDLYHHGMEWSNSKVWLTGTSAQTISFAPISIFTGTYFESKNPHVLNIVSDLRFQNSIIYLHSSTLNITDGMAIDVSGSASRLYSGTFNGNFSLEMTDGSYLYSFTANDSLTLSGKVQIGNSFVTLLDDVRNLDTLQNYGLSAHTLYIQGDFTNEGDIMNGSGYANLTIEFKGNIFHSGTWTNYENRLNGTEDQHVRLYQDLPINAKFILYSNLTGGSYQWYKNGLPIPGATSSNYTMDQITTAEYGTYYCSSAQGLSRLFTINRAMDVGFTANSFIGCEPMTVNFTDQTVSPYTIQSWLWDFGDGLTSTLQNPSHQYQDEGVYDVSLWVSDGYVARQLMQTGYITVNRMPVPAFSFENVCLGTESFFDDLTTGFLFDTTYDTQYASEVIAYCSQWSPTFWSAQQVLGLPNVYPAHIDNPLAWASLYANGQREFLELRFTNPKQINKVIIYETLYPGTVDSVYAKNPTNGQWTLLWSGTATPQPPIARAFEVAFPLTSYLTNEIRIAFNSPAVPYWNEIDAVAIKSPVSVDISAQTTYLWDVGENGITFSTKGDITYTYQNAGIHNVKLTVTNDGICSALIDHDITIYETTVGGAVTGGSTIHWGESTGSLTLTGQTGSVLKWQKRLFDDPWTDIAHTASTYSEVPSAMGSWSYRAHVQNEICTSAFSDPTIVTVLAPLVVTWTGIINEDWNNTGNWNPFFIPEGSINVIIPDPGIHYHPTISSAAQCNDIILQPGAVLTVIPGITLTINGTLTLQQ